MKKSILTATMLATISIGCTPITLTELKDKMNSKSSEIKTLEKKKELNTLNSICSTGKFKSSDVTSKDRSLACDARERLRNKSLEQQWATLDKCDQIKAFWNDLNEQNKQHIFYYRYGERAAKCGYWTQIFEKLLDYGKHQLNSSENPGLTLLINLKKSGYNIHQEMLNYLQKSKNPFPPKKSHISIDNYLAIESYKKWVETQNEKTLCNQYLTDHKRYNPTLKYHILKWANTSKCFTHHDKHIEQLSIDLLEAENYKSRVQSCIWFGRHGSTKHLPKIKVLAENDGTYSIVKKVKIYPVRNVCKSAIGKIQLREK